MKTIDPRKMTAETVAFDLLNILLQEVRLLPDVWAKTPKNRQDEVIERMRKAVLNGVSMAVHIIASDNRTVVAGGLESITIKDGAKAVVKLEAAGEPFLQLCESTNQPVLIVVANPDYYTSGVDSVQGESDQRAMDLGHEYDPNADGQDMATESESLEPIAEIEHSPVTQEQKAQAWQDGHDAAKAGKSKQDVPNIQSELVVEWLAGWNTYHDNAESPSLDDETQSE